LGIPAVVAAVQLAFFSFSCDSPAHLVNKGRTEEAEDILCKIYAGRKADVHDKDGDDMAREQLMALTVAAQDASQAPDVGLVAAFMDPYFRTALTLGVFLAVLQQLCGINALMSYSNLLFSRAGVEPDSLTAASTAMAIGNVVVSLGCSRLLDGWGRRTLFLVGVGIQAIMMCALSLMDGLFKMPALVAICFTLFVMAFSIGLGPVTWLYLSEIYPMEIRGKALGFCGVSNWLASFAVVLGAPFLKLAEEYTLFGGVCTFGFLVIYVWVLETKGCSMDDSPLTPRNSRENSTSLSPVVSNNDLQAFLAKHGGDVQSDDEFDDTNDLHKL
jgi:hypothetical protein